MKGCPARVVASSLLMISVAACAGGPASDAAQALSAPTTVSFRMQPDFPRGGLAGSFGVDHIAVDSAGTYVCVLRRGDDLASLRTRYNPRG